MNYARTRAHIKFCTAKHCVIEHPKSKVEQPCWLLDHLLTMVEEIAVHDAAEKLRAKAKGVQLDLLDPFSPYKEQFIREQADEIDPFHAVNGKLVRRKDGLPVTRYVEGEESDARPGVHPG